MLPIVTDTQIYANISALLHVNCFVCFSIYFMRDGLVTSIASVIIPLVPGRNNYKLTL